MSGISSQMNMTSRKKPKKSALKTHIVLFDEEKHKSYSKFDTLMVQSMSPAKGKNRGKSSWGRQAT